MHHTASTYNKDRLLPRTAHCTPATPPPSGDSSSVLTAPTRLQVNMLEIDREPSRLLHRVRNSDKQLDGAHICPEAVVQVFLFKADTERRRRGWDIGQPVVRWVSPSRVPFQLS